MTWGELTIDIQTISCLSELNHLHLSCERDETSSQDARLYKDRRSLSQNQDFL